MVPANRSIRSTWWITSKRQNERRGSRRARSHSDESQKLNFTEIWIFRGPPPPRNGFPMPTSGVAVLVKKPLPVATPGAAGAIIPLPRKSIANEGNVGFTKFGWLKRLKKSKRHCMFTRSPSFVFLEIAKSKFLKFGPTNALRRRFPK